MSGHEIRVLKEYRVQNDLDRDESEIHEWIGECQAKSSVFPIVVKEYDLRTSEGFLSRNRFSVWIYNWVGDLTGEFISKAELYRVLHHYIRHIAIGVRRDWVEKHNKGITK